MFAILKEKRMRVLMVRMGLAVAVLSAACAAGMAQDDGKRPITFDDLRSMHRIAGPAISPDG